MLARKLTSLGLMRCPRPWRGRKAMRTPCKVPTTIASDGFPKGVESETSRTSRKASIAYNPLPPITPKVTGAVLDAFLTMNPVHLLNDPFERHVVFGPVDGCRDDRPGAVSKSG